jgi:hypothetical protein
LRTTHGNRDLIFQGPSLWARQSCGPLGTERSKSGSPHRSSPQKMCGCGGRSGGPSRLRREPSGASPSGRRTRCRALINVVAQT